MPDTSRLGDCLARYRDSIPGLAHISAPNDSDPAEVLIQRYQQCYPLLEQALWSEPADFDALLDDYQSLFREQEALIGQRTKAGGPPDERHHFILSIPVADRPAHLRACLESILRLCEAFAYGGKTHGIYPRIQIVVAEDSREDTSIRQHLELVTEYREKGLQLVHFGLSEQYELLQSIPAVIRDQLGNLLTRQHRDRFCLKGQAANRNLSILKCLQLTRDPARTLYYFVDSDEVFYVTRPGPTGDSAVYALNYFHYIDRIFRESDTLLLTGKLVGDPPVSPAVMAANFLDDIIAFFTSLSQTRGDSACEFHATAPAAAGDAVYHDMADLFGFDNVDDCFPYHCPLQGAHDHAACLRSLAGRLNAFFFGEHLTRKTRFSYGAGFTALSAARTVYPGNTVASHEGLQYIIPFGHLRLRMSGPTAGRLIAAEIGERFASVNLPHQHLRTSQASLADSFRPGVVLAERPDQPAIDLSNEFERQFFGDLMLFTTEQLVNEADVNRPFDRDRVTRIMDRKEQQLLTHYQQKHDAILQKVRQLDALVFDSGHWWLDEPDLAEALLQTRDFIANIEQNFGEQSSAWRQIQLDVHRAARKEQLINALLSYRIERNAWDGLLLDTRFIQTASAYRPPGG